MHQVSHSSFPFLVTGFAASDCSMHTSRDNSFLQVDVGCSGSVACCVQHSCVPELCHCEKKGGIKEWKIISDMPQLEGSNPEKTLCSFLFLYPVKHKKIIIIPATSKNKTKQSSRSPVVCRLTLLFPLRDSVYATVAGTY